MPATRSKKSGTISSHGKEPRKPASMVSTVASAGPRRGPLAVAAVRDRKRLGAAVGDQMDRREAELGVDLGVIQGAQVFGLAQVRGGGDRDADVLGSRGVRVVADARLVRDQAVN